MEANQKSPIVHETGSPKGSGSAGLHKFLPRFINWVSLFTTSSLHFSICCWNILEIDCMGTIKGPHFKGPGFPKDSGSVTLHNILRCFNTYQQWVWVQTRARIEYWNCTYLVTSAVSRNKSHKTTELAISHRNVYHFRCKQNKNSCWKLNFCWHKFFALQIYSAQDCLRLLFLLVVIIFRRSAPILKFKCVFRPIHGNTTPSVELYTTLYIP